MEKDTLKKLILVSKYVSFVLLPSLSTFVGTVGLATNFEPTTLIITVMSGMSLLIGQLIGEVPIKRPVIKDIEAIDNKEEDK